MANPELDFYKSFFTAEESAFFMRPLTEKIAWEQKSIWFFGKSIMEPRLTAWYGDANAMYTYSGKSMSPRPWTKPLLKIKMCVEEKSGAYFNSVLLNLYRNERDSMGMHSDDETELGPEPVIASVSFGATRKFMMKPRALNKTVQNHTYILGSGDLIVMRGNTQKLWKHGIPKETKPCATRINLTFRKIIF